MLSPEPDLADAPAWHAHLGRRVVCAVFCTLICIEAIAFYPITRYYEKKELDSLAERSLSVICTLFYLLPQKPTNSEISQAANRLLNETPIRGIIVAHEDGTPFLRVGEKPGHAMNYLPRFGYFFTELRTEQGERYDVSWDNTETGLAFDITARLDGSKISEKISTFVFQTLFWMLAGAVFVTIWIWIALNRRVLIPLLALKTKLFNYHRVTELPTRNLLEQHLQQFIKQAEHDKKNVVLFVILLRDFHDITNAFGHSVSVRFLKEVGRHLTENMPAGSCVAHLSTSQFAVAKGGLAGTHQIANLAQWIVDLFDKPILVESYSVITTVNLGIAIYPIDCGDVESLMANAHLALNRAKAGIPNTYQFYETTMHRITEIRRTLLVDLHSALEKNQFRLYYQPQVDLITHQLVGVEALIRWQHPEKGLIPPSLFIPLAEESGLIVALGEWVIQTACQQILSWQAEGLPRLFTAVNLSAIQFAHQNIVDVISRILRKTDVPADQLELEITESAIMNNIPEAISTMKALKGLGVSLSLDDFGTGYASLSYLKQFPIHKLKIDQSFIRDIGKPEHENPLAGIIILLGLSLNLKIIAEGVETEVQANYLRDKGCHEGQGYLFGRPMPADQISEFFKPR